MLQRNERLVLKLLIENGRATDSSMAEKIGITTQAVGKIRRKLEENGIIRGYTAQLDPAAIGLQVHAIGALTCPTAIQQETFRKRVEDDPHITYCERVTYQGHFGVHFAFKDFSESERYFKQFSKAYPDATFPRLQIVSWNCVWKDTMRPAYLHALEDMPDASQTRKRDRQS